MNVNCWQKVKRCKQHIIFIKLINIFKIRAESLKMRKSVNAELEANNYCNRDNWLINGTSGLSNVNRTC